MWSLWECRNCGYRGTLILEDSKLAEKLKEEWKAKKGECGRQPEKELGI